MKLRNLVTVVTGMCVLALAGCTTQQSGEAAEAEMQLSGAYLGQTPPSEEPTVFAPGFISTGMNERDTMISPDGKEFFFTIQVGSQVSVILFSKEVDGVWTKPEVAPFSGKYRDIEPFFTADGNRIYFVSNRPLEAGGEPKEDHDIWYVDREGDGWSEPVNLGAPINTDADEFYPAVTNDGTIYWTAAYGESREDIHRARLVDGVYSEIETLGEAINTGGFEFNSYVSPDESILMFTSLRQGDVGGGDLYISFRNEDGTWSEAKNMGAEFNSTSIDFCPFITPDGEYFFFSSRRTAEKQYPEEGFSYESLKERHMSPQNAQGDIYWMKASVIEKLRPERE